MKTKAAVSTKKQSITVKDLEARKNPKGGATVTVSVRDPLGLNCVNEK